MTWDSKSKRRILQDSAKKKRRIPWDSVGFRLKKNGILKMKAGILLGFFKGFQQDSKPYKGFYIDSKATSYYFSEQKASGEDFCES